MWFCFTGTGTVAALIIIVSLWEKFQTNPTITGLDTDFHNQQVIFPTINVCPLVPYNASRTSQLADILGSYDQEAALKIDPFLQLLTYLSYENIETAYDMVKNFSKLEIQNFNKRSIKSFVSEVVLFCNETFKVCKYKDEEISCCDNFQPIFTENGFCFSFNSRYRETNNKEEVNSNFHDLFETDKKWALNFQPKVKSQIYVHSHHENFGWDFRPQIVWDPDGFIADLLISMKQTYTTEDAKQLSIVQRKCIFPEEVKLDIYSDEYTFTSCMKECRIKKSMKFCKCVPPFYRYSTAQPYCTIEQFQCLAKYSRNITEVRDCNTCELSCSNTVYDIEKLSKTLNTDRTSATYINIEFLTWPIIRYKREVLFGWVDLLVSFGGIAGLFLGFSLLSGVEIIYYFTMRAVCMLFQNKNELQEIEEKKQSRVQEWYNLSLKVNCRKTSAKGINEDQTKIVKVSSSFDDKNFIPFKNAAELPQRLPRADNRFHVKKIRLSRCFNA
ncbi:sodium channel protein Nach isoform X2 [Bradysia coprophila]|uniref:sodium channel protein Nach isoform X2 n=1 Tax=Bradysia coprophila TaxID=38358 RepID=UPI00187D7CAD|nr:sodium channel protein Nach isoform X2 [Bradysia coprophila]